MVHGGAAMTTHRNHLRRLDESYYRGMVAVHSAHAIQALLRSITWRTTPSSPSRSPRTISIDLSDGDGDRFRY